MIIMLGCLMIGGACKGWVDNLLVVRPHRPIREHSPVYLKVNQFN